MAVDEVARAYGTRSAEYIGLFGSIEAAAEQDRSDVLAWAGGIDGPILDLGCGPGQWTGFLAEHGLEVEGVDPVPEFIATARERHPGLRFREGVAEELEVLPGSLGGVLAWFSLIHTDPRKLDGILGRIAGWLRPGGGLLVGFFEGPELEVFEHAVTRAFRWPVADLSQRLERAGLAVTGTHLRTDPGVRPQGTVIARRADRSTIAG